MESAIERNAHDLEAELGWLARVLDARFKLYFGEQPDVANIFDVAPPDLGKSRSDYAQFVNHYEFAFAERLAVVLALAPYIRPQLLDAFHTRNKTFDRRFNEFGGIRHGADGDFWPTGETLAFILAANDLSIRFAVQALFDPRHPFARHDILRLDQSESVEAPMKAPLRLSQDYLSLVTTGETHRPDFGANFPAQYIETALDWGDLVLHPGTRRQIEEIETWIQHGETLMIDWAMAPKLRPGRRILFYGPPGTGKTVTACLLGKSTGRDVYRVDLSLVASKYIGETEKKLAKVFDQAQHKGWILFFDEADALFGKRGETKEAHDRYANQEVSFLLQRVQSFDGIAIFSSNLKGNIDDAFVRRFESIIHFPMPRPKERLRLWKEALPGKAKLEKSIDIEALAREHSLSGGAIMNVIRYAALEALKGGNGTIAAEAVMQGIRREYAKEGKAA